MSSLFILSGYFRNFWIILFLFSSFFNQFRMVALAILLKMCIIISWFSLSNIFHLTHCKSKGFPVVWITDGNEPISWPNIYWISALLSQFVWSFTIALLHHQDFCICDLWTEICTGYKHSLWSQLLYDLHSTSDMRKTFLHK